jgi:hypothetical protein
MEARISALEEDVAAIRVDVAVIRSNYVTKIEFAALKQKFDDELPKLATKADFALLQQKFDDVLPTLATKAELQSELGKMRSWMVGMAVTMFLSLASLQLLMYGGLRSQLLEIIK